jgi:hypothetical protein
MLEPLFFLLQLELFSLGQPFCKMSHFMAFEAHEMRELLLFLLLHLSFISSLAPSLAFDLGLVEANATHVIAAFFMINFASLEANATLVTKVSLSLQHMLKGDFESCNISLTCCSNSSLVH